jgi:oligopeptidase A
MTNFIPFNQIDINYLQTNLNQQLDSTQTLITQLEKQENSSWQQIIAPLQAQLYTLNQAWGLVGHLQSVKDSPELRTLHEEFLPKLTELYVNLGQNQALYKHVQTIKDVEYSQLTTEQKKVIDNELRDFKLSGITLPPEQQQQFKTIQNQLSELATQFEHNVLDATDSYSRSASIDELAGVPEDSVALYKAMAEQEQQEGYKITLHMPSYLPIMQYCSNRQLREELYKAYVTRASELSNDAKFDNGGLIGKILALRLEKANLLGFNNYAELSLFNKMADTPVQVLDFLHQLAIKSRPYAEQDLLELKAYALQTDGIAELSAWDIPYYSEKLQQHKYSYSSNELKQYFPLPKVFSGLFNLIGQLYSLELVLNKEMSVWHSDVSAYDIIQNGEVSGHIYFDLYARDGKQPGAWMNSAQDRNMDGESEHLPIAYVICNFTKPVGDKPSLLTFDDVQTLFHEMGHALHHLLTVVDNSSISGINGVEWDAVELPSQFMEYFAWDYAILKTITAHIDSGEALPQELFDKVLAARHYQSGLQMLRQLEFAIYDLQLHSSFNPAVDNYLIELEQVRKQIAVLIPPSYNRFANSFAHIFAGGYAAGYYSYKWAEVLACDVFSVFDRVSGSKLSELGTKLQNTILSQGGVRPMMENFVAFMGREPQIDALLKYSGIK